MFYTAEIFGKYCFTTECAVDCSDLRVVIRCSNCSPLVREGSTLGQRGPNVPCYLGYPQIFVTAVQLSTYLAIDDKHKQHTYHSGERHFSFLHATHAGLVLFHGPSLRQTMRPCSSTQNGNKTPQQGSYPCVTRQQGKSEGFDSCDRPSNLTQIGFRSSINQPTWPWNLMNDIKKTIRHLFDTTSSFVHHFKSIVEFKLESQSGNAQFG